MEKQRVLYYVQILAHSSEELGSLAKALAKKIDIKAHDEIAYRFWSKVRQAMKEKGLNQPEICQKLHIYVDGLSSQLYYCKVCFEKTGKKYYMDEIESNKIQCSVCGSIVPAAMEEPLMQLVSFLTKAKVPQYLMIEKLIERGAKIHGTESQQLLEEEHKMWLNATNGAGINPQRAAALLQERDEFIAKRINETLPENEIGILFIGAAHKVADEIKKFSDIKVIFL